MADPKRRGGRAVSMCAYQIKMPLMLRRKALDKARANGTTIAEFVRMAIEQFVEDPIEQSMDKLRKHKRRYEQR